VRAGYSNRPDGERKGRPPEGSKKSAPADDTPRRFNPPCPAEKARRVDALRAALAGTAPDFEDQLRQAGEDDR
jgi:hypothetical protein